MVLFGVFGGKLRFYYELAIESTVLNEEYIRGKIHTIRGFQVMLDKD